MFIRPVSLQIRLRNVSQNLQMNLQLMYLTSSTNCKCPPFSRSGARLFHNWILLCPDSAAKPVSPPPGSALACGPDKDPQAPRRRAQGREANAQQPVASMAPATAVRSSPRRLRFCARCQTGRPTGGFYRQTYLTLCRRENNDTFDAALPHKTSCQQPRGLFRFERAPTVSGKRKS